MTDQSIRYFQHFKGEYYKLLMIGKDSETQNNVVIYQALYGERGVWVRDEKMFFEQIERDGKKIPRFRELSREEIEQLRMD